MSRLRASLESWAAIRTSFSSFQDAGHVGRVGEIESNRTIVLQRDNTITLLFDKRNIMLFCRRGPLHHDRRLQTLRLLCSRRTILRHRTHVGPRPLRLLPPQVRRDLITIVAGWVFDQWTQRSERYPDWKSPDYAMAARPE